MISQSSSADAWFRAALYLFVLVLALMGILLIFLRASRRYRQRLLEKPAKPTAVPDIWSMHKLPDEKRGQEP